MKKTPKKNHLQYLIAVVITAAIIMLIAATAFNNRLTVRNYHINTEKISSGKEITVVLLADLHCNIYGRQQQELIQLILKQDPDLIILCGDIFDDRKEMQNSILLLQGIKNIPSFYVTGNHEYWSEKVRIFKEISQANGVTVLSDSYEKITVKDSNLIIAGIEDPEKKAYQDSSYEQEKEMDRAFNKIKDDTGILKILAAHRPERINSYKKYNFDLILSGHTHGGQFRIPLLVNGIFAPNQGFFPKYAGGLYKHEGLTHIISRGLSINKRLPRIYNPPEIVVIKLTNKNSQP